jgi:hypothetical protein
MAQTINNSQFGDFSGDQEIAATLENITPYMAKKYLETQGVNRTINPLRVLEYADRMKKGQWLVGQAITFDSDGCLIDGQHRLEAVIKYGNAVNFLVVRGVAKESASVFDVGQKRTMAQVAKIQGIDHPQMTERNGILNSALIGSRLKTRTIKAENERNSKNLFVSKAAARSFQTMIGLAVKYQEGLDFTLITRGTREERKPIGNLVAVKSAIFRAYYNVNRQRLAEFVQVLQSGFQIRGDIDTAAITLRTFLCNLKTGEKKVSIKDGGELEIYQKTEYAILNFTEKKSRKTLTMSGFEEFPLADFD